MANELLIGFGGAVVGGLFAIGAAWQSHRHNLKLERVQNERRIDGILQAIRCELVVMQDFYDSDIGGDLKKVKEGQSYNGHFSMMTEKYFIVYPNNTEIVGQIGDSELVKSVVTVYNKANLLIEGFRMNNWYLDRAKEIETEQHNAEGEVFAIASTPSMNGRSLGSRRKEQIEQQIIPALVDDLKNLKQVRIEHTFLLKKSDADLHAEVKKLVSKLDDYRQRHPVEMD